ncbi:GNAT family N-acetyltransferase [Enterovibrio norvegicus]|uniref:GNAT family N-acetyltransferase n=1 Tax=Enterovibrio norvegicus TaxID=188144 RepID=UPI00352F5B61
MLLRSEAPADLLPIDRLVKKAFDTDAEAKLVMTLRENGHNTLSLVACNDDGKVVGHIMFSPVIIGGRDTGIQGLAPVCVHHDYRKQGLASDMIREGFEILSEFGYPACVVLGDPAYYSRVGFVPASQYSLTCKWDVPADAFMAIELLDGAFSDVTGLVEYCAEFDAL